MSNQFITHEWLSKEWLRLMTVEMGAMTPLPGVVSMAAVATPVAPIQIPPSLLITGLAIAVAAKVPFSRRRLIMPWKVDES